VALDLAEDVRRAVARAQAALRTAAGAADVRWTPVDQLHVTLKFLGEVAAERLAEIEKATAAAAAGHAPPSLVARGMGGFPSARRPRVVWAGLVAGPELAALAASVERELAALGIPPENRPFRAHVTLGRVRSATRLGRLATAIEAAADTRFGAWTPTELTLYQSRLRPSGAVHEPLAHLPLATILG
jgi:2'-5' RNA ligase